MTPQQFVRDRLVWLAAGSVALGVLLIVLAETLHWEWTKLFGASFIALGGVGLGVEFGLSQPRGWGIVDKIKAARLPVSYIIIALTTVPMLLVLLAVFIGMFGDTSGSPNDMALIEGGSGWGLMGGVAITLFMIIASLAAIGMTVSSVQRAFRKAPVGAAAEDAKDQPREGDA